MRAAIGILIILIAGAAVWILIASSHKSQNQAATIGSLTSLATTTMTMTLTSSAFGAGGTIPDEYTCDGPGTNPALSWSGAPAETQSYALIMEDPDIPEAVKQSMGIDVFDHWLVYDIPVSTTSITENAKPPGDEGLNGMGKQGYVAPCPPDKEHRYVFTVYALDTTLSFDSPPNKAQLVAAMEGHVLAEGELIGLYNRVQNR